MFEYQENRFNRKLNRRVVILTVLAMIVGFFGMNSLMTESHPGPLEALGAGKTVIEHYLLMLLGGLAAAGTLMGLYWALSRLWKRIAHGL